MEVASSAESVGVFRLGKASKIVKQSQHRDLYLPETIRSSLPFKLVIEIPTVPSVKGITTWYRSVFVGGSGFKRLQQPDDLHHRVPKPPLILQPSTKDGTSWHLDRASILAGCNPFVMVAGKVAWVLVRRSGHSCSGNRRPQERRATRTRRIRPSVLHNTRTGSRAKNTERNWFDEKQGA